MTRTLTNGYFIAAFGLARVVHGYLPGTGSSAAGNLSTAAPYGIPPEEFTTVTEEVFSTATFNITGYNVSENAGPSGAPGWTLTVDITTDVSLQDAANQSNFDVEVTTLSIEPPGGNITLDPSWRICAVVFTGLAKSTSPSTPIDGTCGSVLSSGCVQGIESGSSGMDENGDCTTYTLPSSCTSFFPAESVNTSAITINQTVLDAKRFYAYGSPSTQTANVTAYQEAVVNVWPVITLFSHLSADDTRDSLNTAIQCVRASNGTTTAPSSPLSAAGQLRVPNVFAYGGFSVVVFLAAVYTLLW